jgi:hypothetical protein
VDVVPNAPAYVPDLDSVANGRLIAHFSEAQRQALERNGFVVVPAAHEQFYDIYYSAERGGIPAFVTSDALLHTYHVLYDSALRETEEQQLIADVEDLSRAMQRAAEALYDSSEGAVREAALQNLAYFTVAVSLLGPDAKIPAPVSDVVERELALIGDHETITHSPIFGYDEDYSQYVPRGHYTRGGDAARETRSALLAVGALHTTPVGNGLALDVWERIYNVTAFFVGTADDLTVHDYASLAREVYGDLPDLDALADETRLEAFIEAAKELRPPAILSSPLLPGENPETAARSFRFMGQRYIPDSDIFQQLIFDKVTGAYRGGADLPFTALPGYGYRSFPRGLDIPAGLGSARALAILDADGDTDYDGYDTQLTEVRHQFANVDEARWTSNLYWNWLHSLRPLLDVRGEGFPYFMRSESWTDKSLNTWLGSWTQLRHDAILYAKPTYPPPASLPPQADGYVEPNPWLYARLAALAAQQRAGLADRGLLTDRLEARLRRMENLLLALKTISEKELGGETLTDGEFNTIRYIDSALKDIASAKDSSFRRETDDKVALVADVHTVPDTGQVLEEAVGDVFEIYVVLPLQRPPSRPVSGDQVVMLGGVFSYYEFKWPLNDRLTDEKWREMEPLPPLPSWTRSFVVGPEGDPLAARRSSE